MKSKFPNAKRMLCVLALGAAPMFAQTSSLTPQEQTFLQEFAHQSATAEELGRIASEKGFSEETRMMGTHLMKGHQESNAELQKLANSKHVQVDLQPSPAEKEIISQMQQKSGEDFDKAFREHVAADRQRTIKTFENAANEATDPDVKAFAKEGIREHHPSEK